MNTGLKRTLCAIFTALLLIVSAESVWSDSAGDAIIWSQTANRAQEAIAGRVASIPELERLRAELASQRAELKQRLDQGSIETRILQARLELLGPPPPEGQTEATTVAAIRLELINAIADADSPLSAARQAHKRADILITELNKQIRTALTDKLLERNPTPLIPATWLTAGSELVAFIGKIIAGIKGAANDPVLGPRLANRARLAATFLALAFAGICILQPLMFRRWDRPIDPELSRSRRIYLISLAIGLRLLLPTLTIGLIVAAVWSVNLAGQASKFNAVLLLCGIFWVGASWLAHLLFAPSAPDRRILRLAGNQPQAAVWTSLGLGVVLMVDTVLEFVEMEHLFTPAALSVYSALIVVFGSFCLWQLANQLGGGKGQVNQPGSPGAEASTKVSMRHILAQMIRLAAIAALVSSVIGYVQLARQAMEPTILSLAVLGFSVAIHRLVVTAFGLLVNGDQGTKDSHFSLLPVFVGLVLLGLTLPIHALVWGARLAELSELWVLLDQGVEIGGAHLSITVVVLLVVIFSLCYAATRWLQKFLRLEILPKTRLDVGGQNAIATGFGYTGVILSMLVAISAAGLDLANLAIVAGALSVGIGFGMQAIVSNFISGIILLIERPIKEGDWIEVAGHSGIVRKIAVRSTRIETFDRYDVIIPNSELIAGSVANMTLTSKTGRIILPVGVAYGSDVVLVKKILLDAARQHPMTLFSPEPIVLFTGLGESTLDFELRCFIRDVQDKLVVRSDLLFAIFADLGRAGVEIPFPQRSVTLTNVEALATALVGKAKETV